MSSTRLKVVALFFMILDHVAEFIPGTPEYLHWIGRFSAPIFFFCMSWGFYYTQNRKKYLLRMYLCCVVMAISNVILQNIFQSEIINNIFGTLFISSLLIYALDSIKKDQIRGLRLIVCFIVWQILGTGIIVFLDWYGIYLNVFMNSKFYAAILANCFFNEGGIMFVLLGVFFYYTKDSKSKLTITFMCFSFVYTILYATNIPARIIMKAQELNIFNNTIQFILCGLFQTNWFPTYGTRFYKITNYYWLVIGALPFIMLYNGKKGKGYKYFFYIFYPVHIYILYMIGSMIG